MIPAVVLAAGASTRLGSPKQIVLYDGETLLDRAIRTAQESGCHPIVVVLGANAPLVRQICTLAKVVVHINPRWQEGMASSIRLGIQSIPDADGVCILTCDQPTLTPAHLQALVATGELTASRYAGRNGVPAFFPVATFPALLALSGDRGARDLLHDAPSITLEGGELDIDTPEDAARLLHRPLSTT